MKRFLPGFFLCLILLACHVSSVVHVYGYNDDYHIFFDVLTGQFSLAHHTFTVDGRFLTSGMIKLFVGSTESIEGLRWLRLLSIIGIICSALLLLRILRKGGFGHVESLLVSLLIFTTPAFAVYSSWTITFTFPLGVMAALMTGFVFHCSIFREDISSGLKCVYAVVGVVLTAIVYSVYQPVAFFGLFSACLLQWRRFGAFRKDFIGLMKLGILFCLATLLYKFSYDYISREIFGNELSLRAEWVSDYAGKLSYLSTYSFPAIFGGWWSMISGEKVAFLIFVFMTLVIFVSNFYCGKSKVAENSIQNVWEGFLSRILALCMLFFFSTFLFVLTKENILAYRLYSGASALIIFAIITGVSGTYIWVRDDLPAWGRRLFAVFTVFYVGIWLLLSFWIPHKHFHKLNAEEYHAAEVIVGEKLDFFPSELGVILPAHYEREMGDLLWGEFKARSAHLTWVGPKMFQALLYREFFPEQTLRESFMMHPEFKLYYGMSHLNELSVPVVDLFESVHRGNIEWVQHPYLGLCRKVRHLEYYHSEVFGGFDNNSFPYIYHLGLGWIHLQEFDEAKDSFLGSVFEFDGRAGTFNSSQFPRIYFQDSNEWYRYEPRVWFGQKLYPVDPN